jgi:hypothetical protein
MSKPNGPFGETNPIGVDLCETVGLTANHGLQENPFPCFRLVIYNRKTNQNVWTPIDPAPGAPGERSRKVPGTAPAANFC